MKPETAIPVFFIGLPAIFFGVLFLVIAVILKIKKAPEDKKLIRRFAIVGSSLVVLALVSPLLDSVTTPIVSRIIAGMK
jgi:hypothetical protein